MALDDTERAELRDAARRLLTNESSLDHVRRLLDDGEGFDRRLWRQMAELGWLAIHVPEALGGMGASYTDVVVVLHELGRQLVPAPFLASAILGTETLARTDNADPRDAWLPGLLSGEAIVTVANANADGSYEPARLSVGWRSSSGVRLDGLARFVPHAHVADAIVVAATDATNQITLAVVERDTPGVRVTVEPTVDATRRLCRVELDDVAVADEQLLCAPGTGGELLARLTSIGAIAVMADALGAAEHMLEVSVQYAKERQQFGRPIGSFQAVKHHCADMLIAVEGTRASVTHAATSLDDPDGDVDEAASVAKSYGGPASVEACQLAVQVHGGIGFTWEHDAHLYLKRALLDDALFGSAAWHRRHLGAGITRDEAS